MIKGKLQDLVPEDFDDKEFNPSIVDLNKYLQGKPPGSLISYLLSDIPLTPTTYKTSCYVLRGSIRTDGFRLELLTFKFKELNAMKYRRLQDDVLPNRLTSTSGGVDYYLTEARNIVKTPLDVANLWGCAADPIKILYLDLG
ncbi:hypothetical protein BGZ51_001060 [Haplosporangium sp. Z 767]|nr:hypothetical protein BGZ51_001060 [Haplosporangium sp. Z 767]